MAEVFKSSINVKIEVNLNFDLSNYTSIEYIVQKPDKTKTVWRPIVENEATGLTCYYTLENDLNMAGTYMLQPKVVFGANDKLYYGKIVSFDVCETL